MRVRTAIVLTAILSAMLGAVAAYLVLTVPNDIQAGALMKKAKEQIAARKNDDARDTLSRIVQQYPRTDAAAAATVALIKLESEDGDSTKKELAQVRSSLSTALARIAAVESSVAEIKNAPPPAPVVKQEPPKAAPKKRAKPRRSRRRRR